jgi:hypothetical protein
VREAEAMASHIGLDQGRRFPQVHRQNREPLAFVFLIEGFESRPLSLTPGSPGGPKVHQDNLPTERPQRHVFALHVR